MQLYLEMLILLVCMVGSGLGRGEAAGLLTQVAGPNIAELLTVLLFSRLHSLWLDDSAGQEEQGH